MSFTGSEVELARSVEFFQQPTSYKRFWLNRHAQIPEGCIDPRDEDRPEVHIIRQTPGGAAGRAVDTALSLYAYDKTEVGLCESLAYDESLGHSMVATAHRRCAYDLGREKIIDEIIDPSDFTKEALHRISRESNLDYAQVIKRVDALRLAAEAVKKTIVSVESDAFLESVNSLFSAHSPVADVKGDNQAGVYIWNHHPYVGLDRNKVHRGKTPLVAHAYHDNVRATIVSVRSTPNMPTPLRDLRIAAVILRSAVTPAVVVGNDARARLLHVKQGRDGLLVEEQLR
jgi:hypothetical protein